jgi:hypothetical protein
MSWDEKREAKDGIEVPDMPALVTFPFNEHKLVAPLILRIEVSGIANGQQDLFVKVARKNPQEPTNLRNLASMPYFKKLWNAGTESVCHLVKIDPSKPFDALSLEVNTKASSSDERMPRAEVMNNLGHESAAHIVIQGLKLAMQSNPQFLLNQSRSYQSRLDNIGMNDGDDDDDHMYSDEGDKMTCKVCNESNPSTATKCAEC